MSVRAALIVALLFIPLLVALGLWQLQRADEKQAVLLKQELRATAAPVEFAVLENLERSNSEFLRVIVAGHYDVKKSMLLDNRVRHGRVGYEVLTPFLTDGGEWVLINRGWIPAERSRAQMPQFSTPTERVVLEVHVAPEPRRKADLQVAGADWPKVIQQLDILAARPIVDLPLLKVELRLSPGEVSAFDAQWPAINMKPEKHTAYAVQWFALAALLMLLLLRAVWRNNVERNK